MNKNKRLLRFCVKRYLTHSKLPDRLEQSVTCLATDASLTAESRQLDPGPVPYFRGDWLRSLSSLPLNHSRRIVVSYKRKYVHELLVNCLLTHAQEKSVLRWTDRPAMTIGVDLGHKATKQRNNKFSFLKEGLPSWKQHVHLVGNTSKFGYCLQCTKTTS